MEYFYEEISNWFGIETLVIISLGYLAFLYPNTSQLHTLQHQLLSMNEEALLLNGWSEGILCDEATKNGLY